jgi:Sec-independent protein secretion pathway component TatC
MKSTFLKKWLPIVGISFLIPIIISLILGTAITQALVASGLTVLLVVTGLVFRSYGRERERKSGFENP